MSKKKIEWAGREKRRQVASAVGKNFFKTLTEPITNSDSALKKKAGVPHAAGLVDEILKLRVGDALDSSALKLKLPKHAPRKIEIHLTTAGKEARRCAVVDYGIGMTASELGEKFGMYASAKARGENTRSLFGRGALDVLLHHRESRIYSVKNGQLAACDFGWDKDEPYREVRELGVATPASLSKLDLPAALVGGGTAVIFKVTEQTSIPSEESIVPKMSSFYMLRLIAADPNTEVTVHRYRTKDTFTDRLQYDFPIGDVLLRKHETLRASGKELPVDILVARARQELAGDPVGRERRENGLLFVDENDAVMDLTLGGEWDRQHNLNQIFGVVRVSGLRAVLEEHLESEDDPVAVLSETRDGFDQKHPLTKALFDLVEKHVRPVYEREINRRRKREGSRSERLSQRIQSALKALNHFNSEETNDTGSGSKRRQPKGSGAIFFSQSSVTLYTGEVRRITLSVDLQRVKHGEIVLFESDNPLISIDPESQEVRARKAKTHDLIALSLTCGIKGTSGQIRALTLDVDGKEVQAEVAVVDVADPPIKVAPEHIAFSSPSFSGQPNKENHAFLLVNLTAFSGLPEITFDLERRVGNLSLEGGEARMKVKVQKEHVTGTVARIPLAFFGSGWGQSAELQAKAKAATGETVRARCKLKIERVGTDKFSNVHYEDLGRPVLGGVAQDKLYINAGYKLHKSIFGEDEASFNEALENSHVAQIRAAGVLVEAVLYSIAEKKYHDGSTKGLDIDPDDPIGSLRSYLEESRMKLEPEIMRALAPEAVVPRPPRASAGARVPEQTLPGETAVNPEASGSLGGATATVNSQPPHA